MNDKKTEHKVKIEVAPKGKPSHNTKVHIHKEQPLTDNDKEWVKKEVEEELEKLPNSRTEIGHRVGNKAYKEGRTAITKGHVLREVDEQVPKHSKAKFDPLRSDSII